MRKIRGPAKEFAMGGDKDMSARLTQEEIRFLLGARDYEPLPTGLEGAASPERNGEGAFGGIARLPALPGKKNSSSRC